MDLGIDLFGLKTHDEQHENTEVTLRRLVEQVAQLSIDLGQTRTDLRKVYLLVEGKIDAGDVDPALSAANEALGLARERLTSLQASADEQWNDLRQQLDGALAEAAAVAAALDDD